MSWSRAQSPNEPSDGRIESACVESATDDAALVTAARINRQNFRPLYERYVRQIHGYCYLRLGSRQAAEDATSEVFLNTATTAVSTTGTLLGISRPRPAGDAACGARPGHRRRCRLAGHPGAPAGAPRSIHQGMLAAARGHGHPP